MVCKRVEGDLCKSYRPCTFSDIVGQEQIVNSLRKSVLNKSSSKCFLFHGESGCGKSTTAFVVSMALNCENVLENGDPCCECSNCLSMLEGRMPDYKEINAADAKGINEVRAIIDDLKLNPMFGNVKVYVLEESHGMTIAAQKALLKEMDSLPDGAYIILTSTEPKKMEKPLVSRCEGYRFKLLKKEEVKSLVEIVSAIEGASLSSDVLDAVVLSSELRPRNALKILQVAMNLSDKEDSVIIEAVSEGYVENKNVFDLCRILINKSSWGEIIRAYKNIDTSYEEAFISVQSYFRAVLEKSSKPDTRAAYVLGLFTEKLPDVKPENRIVYLLYKAYSAYNSPGFLDWKMLP